MRRARAQPKNFISYASQFNKFMGWLAPQKIQGDIYLLSEQAQLAVEFFSTVLKFSGSHWKSETMLGC